VAWLSAAASKALSAPVALSAREVLTNPDAVAFVDSESGRKFTFTLLPPDHIRQMAKKRRASKASRLNGAHPLLPIRRGTEVVELNMLNGGLLLDLELPHAWRTLTSQDTTAERLWMYVL
jgi:hypothetical protein